MASKIKIGIIHLGILIFVVWVARYFYAGGFGLYEDDLTIIPRAMQMDFRELLSFIFRYIASMSGHARPLSDSFIYISSNMGWKLAGFRGPYLFGFVITCFNVVLFYGLLRRIGGLTFSFFGALGYALFSADTTQAYLTHSLGLQPSITILLLASHAYLSDKKILAYLLALIILFSYEVPYVVFFAVPLLTGSWDRKKLRELASHSAILLGFLFAVFLFRLMIGEGRITELTPTQMIMVPLTHMIQGPLVSIGSYLLRFWQVVNLLELDIIFVIFGAYILIMVGIVWTIKAEHTKDQLTLQPTPVSTQPSFSFWRMVVAGTLMLVLAYPLTFTTRAYAISGRETRVHAAANIGSGILVGCLGSAALNSSLSLHKKRLLSASAALLFSGLVGYGFVIQHDYVQGWNLQKQFWSELFPLIKDAEAGDVILIEPTGLVDVEQIGANTWNLPRVLEQIIIFPDSWVSPPRVYRLIPEWQNWLESWDGSLRLDAETTLAPESLFVDFNSENIIFISTSSGKMERRLKPLPLREDHPVKQIGVDQLSTFQYGFLYQFLIQP